MKNTLHNGSWEKDLLFENYPKFGFDFAIDEFKPYILVYKLLIMFYTDELNSYLILSKKINK